MDWFLHGNGLRHERVKQDDNLIGSLDSTSPYILIILTLPVPIPDKKRKLT